MEPPRSDEVSARPDEGPFAVRGCPVTDVPFGSFLRTDDRPVVAWAHDDATVAARGATATITAEGPSRFSAVRDRAADLFAGCDLPADLPQSARPRLFGGFAFHDGEYDGDDTDWDGFPGAAFVLPEVQITTVDDATWLTVSAMGDDAGVRAEERLDTWRDRLATMDALAPTDPPGVQSRRRTPSRSGWREQVGAALEGVSTGDLQKVVLAQALSVGLDGELSVPAVISRLAQTYPDCYRFAFAPPDAGTFFGATPERLVSVRGRTVRTEALAGSTGRGDTPAEDEWLAGDLLDSEKDRHEHQLVVDAIRDQLDPLAATVRTGELTVRRLATVQHLRTSITAELREDEHVLSLVEALHPTPAVGGLPPDAALETIRRTETFDRGWYAAPIGWFDAAGNGTFAVGIRSAVARDRSVTLFAGAGIVEDSDPDREWDEVQLKYRPILDELE